MNKAHTGMLKGLISQKEPLNSIQRLPTYLILHLKRFEFDFRTCRNRKVDDRCEFPVLLDMAKYTVDGGAGARGCLYELEGVLPCNGRAQWAGWKLFQNINFNISDMHFVSGWDRLLFFFEVKCEG